MAAAMSSLPVPVSPLINTVESVGATILTMPSTRRKAALLPIMRGNPLLGSSLSTATCAEVTGVISKDALSFAAGSLSAQLAGAAIALLLSFLYFRRVHIRAS
jgi:hypothetical protein